MKLKFKATGARLMYWTENIQVRDGEFTPELDRQEAQALLKAFPDNFIALEYPKRKPGKKLRILSCLCAYNEMDILPHLLKYLHSQGIDTFTFDNYSTDGTWEFLKDNHYDCARLNTNGQLNLVQIIKAKMQKWNKEKPDWCIYQDSDEFPLTSEFPTLREFIENRGETGYNAISQTRVPFLPTGEENSLKDDPRRIFKYYHHTFRCAPNMPVRSERIFQYSPHIDLATGAGHFVQGLGEKTSKETLKNPIFHYPLRKNPEMKTRQRLERCPDTELNKHWHIHYVRMIESGKFTWDKNELSDISNPKDPLYGFYARIDKENAGE